MEDSKLPFLSFTFRCLVPNRELCTSAIVGRTYAGPIGSFDSTVYHAIGGGQIGQTTDRRINLAGCRHGHTLPGIVTLWLAKLGVVMLNGVKHLIEAQ